MSGNVLYQSVNDIITPLTQAGKLYMDADMMKEALDMFMAGNYWDKARHIATNIAPRYEQYIEDAYVDYLKEHNKTEEVRRCGLYL